MQEITRTIDLKSTRLAGAVTKPTEIDPKTFDILIIHFVPTPV